MSGGSLILYDLLVLTQLGKIYADEVERRSALVAVFGFPQPNAHIRGVTVYVGHHSNLETSLMEVSLVDADRINPDPPICLWLPQATQSSMTVLSDNLLSAIQVEFVRLCAVSPSVGHCFVDGWLIGEFSVAYRAYDRVCLVRTWMQDKDADGIIAL